MVKIGKRYKATCKMIDHRRGILFPTDVNVATWLELISLFVLFFTIFFFWPLGILLVFFFLNVKEVSAIACYVHISGRITAIDVQGDCHRSSSF